MLKIILMIRGREWWIAIDFMESRHHGIKPGSVWLLWSRLWRLCAFSRCKKKRRNCVTVYFFGRNCFSCDCSFSANMSKLPKPNKKNRFISIFIFGQGKSVPSPPSIFSKKISGENIDLDSQRVTSRPERLSSWKWYFREIVCPSSHHILKVDTWVKLTASFGTRVQFNISAAAPRLSKEMVGTFTLSQFCRTN